MDFLAYLAFLLLLGVVAQWLAWRMKLPSILLLLILGFALSHFTGMRIDNYLKDEGSLLSLVGFFVAIILFEGGLTLKFSELKEAGTPVLKLCTTAVVLAFGLTAVAARYTLGYHWQICALLGAILVVTGPTVVAPLLRLIRPRRKVASIVKWEGIVVDPIGAVLAVLVFITIQEGGVGQGWDIVAIALVKTLIVGVGLGWGLAKVTEGLMSRHLIPDFLESMFFLALVGVAFAGSNAIQHEAGLLTVTVLGVALANQKKVSVRHILEFKENLRVLIISLLFLMLSGRIGMSEIQMVWQKGLMFLLVLILVVRPASVFLANLGSVRTTFREQLFLALLAPRGIVAAAVTSVFALQITGAAKLNPENETYIVLAEEAGELVPLVFIVILGTVTFYGLLAAPLARRLGLSEANPTGVLFAGAEPWIRVVAKGLVDKGHHCLLLDTRFEKVSAARLEGLQAVRANILSEYAEEEIDFAGLGHLVAATPNNEVNSLAAREFQHRFGKANVWQITPSDVDFHHQKAVANHMRGRFCFLGGPRFSDLSSFVEKGAEMKSTLLTDVFTMEDFKTAHGDKAIILFIETEDGKLSPVLSEDEEIDGSITIHSLVLEQDNPEAKALKKKEVSEEKSES
ncbi:MAG: cation:proton antiporter [Akkermansiaceae bacterium]|jgi:NhaP-type Na+/H+ or K+/H+ antiporter|nr:cation:proton antiporter [Akkermansiaceae bacterium]|tara:strand:- start:7432 stop:9315 length:1884 start_codon:yes stop_codon:yes gene_type:complete